MRCAREPLRAHRITPPYRSADTERLAHLAEAEAGLLVLLAERLLAAVRLLTHLAEPAAPRLLTLLAAVRLLTLLAAVRLLTLLLTLLALLEQRHDGRRQRLLHGLLHRVADSPGQRAVQRDGQVRVGLLGQLRPLLELLLDLLDLLERLLHLLGDLLGRLLARLLDGLLNQLGDLLRAGLLADLLQGLGTGHHRHECSISLPPKGRPT
ncbi:hypothetical protein SNL152K_5184 [Streptomyces sp. NL15-2K]|nr:hypothetical protein SNL152K_5184 [Streptomyces sp. NL15-2K]